MTETLIHCWWECKIVQHCGNSLAVSYKVEHNSCRDLAMQLLGIYLREMKICVQKPTQIVITVPFVISKSESNSNAPYPTNEWINKLAHSYHEYYPTIIRNKCHFLQQIRWIPKALGSERSQSQTIWFHLYNYWEDKTVGTENRLVTSRSQIWGEDVATKMETEEDFWGWLTVLYLDCGGGGGYTKSAHI